MLEGKTIINTRPSESADLIGQELKAMGMEVIPMPLIEIIPIPIPKNIQASITKEKACDWLVFTSRNGVDMFFEQMDDPFHFNELPIRIAVYGKRTAMAMEERGLKPDVVNLKNTSADLLDDLLPLLQPNEKVLLVLGDLASSVLEEGLANNTDVARLDVYKTVFVQKVDQQLLQKIQKDDYDLLLFTSPSGFKSFMNHTHNADQYPELKIACLGPTTESAIHEKGMKPLVVAKPSGKMGLLKGIRQYFNKQQD